MLDADGRSVVVLDLAALIRVARTDDTTVETDEKGHLPMIQTTLHLGQAPGRARRRVVCSRLAVSAHLGAWRAISPVHAGAAAYTAGNPAGGVGFTAGNFMSATATKRPARHLGTRST